MLSQLCISQGKFRQLALLVADLGSTPGTHMVAAVSLGVRVSPECRASICPGPAVLGVVPKQNKVLEKLRFLHILLLVV